MLTWSVIVLTWVMLEPLDLTRREPLHYNNYKETKDDGGINKFVKVYGLCLFL